MFSRNTDVAVAVFHYVVCVAGLTANILVCSVILKHKRTVFANSFYTLALAVAVPDSLHLITELCCSLPAVFHGLDRTPKQFLHSCGFLTDVAFFAIVPIMLVIAVNRYIAVCHFDLYQRYFDAKLVRRLLLVCVLFSLAMPTMMYACSCYSEYKYAWLYVCHGGCQRLALDLNVAVANSVCAAIAGTYLLIVVRYRLIHGRVAQTLGIDETRQRAKERRLMLQFGLICAVLLTYLVCFWTLDLGTNTDLAEVVLNFFANLNSCCSPFLYLIFSTEIRHRLPWRNRHSSNSKMEMRPCAHVMPASVTVVRPVDIRR